MQELKEIKFFKMKCNVQLRFLLISINALLSLGINLKKFDLYQFENELNFKFVQDFENSYLLEDFHVTNENSLKLLKCLVLSSKNRLTKSVSYELTNSSTIRCKSYSSYLQNSSHAEISLSSQSKIFSMTREKLSSYNEFCNGDDFFCSTSLSCINGLCQCSSGE